MEQHEDLWHVQLESGEVRVLTLDQLDAFYQNGIIDEQTYVLEDGSMDWRTLGDVLGVTEPEPAPPPSVVVYEPFLSMRPVVSEIDAAELEGDVIPFKRSKGKYFVAAGAIGAVVAVVAVMAASRIGSHASPANVSAAVVNVTPERPASVIPPPPPPVVQTPALNDDVKKALADKDTKLNQKIEQRKQNRAKNTPPPAHKTSPPPFRKDGNTHDPLNSKI
jgi:hypothetical protein